MAVPAGTAPPPEGPRRLGGISRPLSWSSSSKPPWAEQKVACLANRAIVGAMAGVSAKWLSASHPCRSAMWRRTALSGPDQGLLSHRAMWSATMMVGRFGVPVGTVGMIDASATVRPSMPWTVP